MSTSLPQSAIDLSKAYYQIVSAGYDGAEGLALLEEQIKKGCKCKHMALMSGYFTDEDVSKANLLGLKIFKKPFDLSELINWLDQVEKDIDPKRKLSDFF